MYTSGTIRKAGGGGGSCLAEEGEVPYMSVPTQCTIRSLVDVIVEEVRPKSTSKKQIKTN